MALATDLAGLDVALLFSPKVGTYVRATRSATDASREVFIWAEGKPAYLYFVGVAGPGDFRMCGPERLEGADLLVTVATYLGVEFAGSIHFVTFAGMPPRDLRRAFKRARRDG